MAKSGASSLLGTHTIIYGITLCDTTDYVETYHIGTRSNALIAWSDLIDGLSSTMASTG